MNSDPDVILPEDTVASSEERREALEILWQAVLNTLIRDINKPNPTGQLLDCAINFLRQNGHTKDLKTASHIHEALQEVSGLEAPLR